MTYPVCPKCGHAPLPADQALPAACPACGIVLAKFGATPVSTMGSVPYYYVPRAIPDRSFRC